MRARQGRAAAAAMALTAPLALATEAFAQPPAEFYKVRNVELIGGWAAGAGYDVYARFLARHMGRHIPGAPSVVVQNMAGAGSLRAANFLYNAAAKDGTVLGMIGRGTAFDPLLLASTPA